jgi:hypothetical protein
MATSAEDEVRVEAVAGVCPSSLLSAHQEDSPIRLLTASEISDALANLASQSAAVTETPVSLGDRVIVNGKFGGTLRYWGTVQFSHGLWAGVELDDPGNASCFLYSRDIATACPS